MIRKNGIVLEVSAYDYCPYASFLAAYNPYYGGHKAYFLFN